MADLAQGYRIQSGTQEMAAALSTIDLKANSLFSEEDVPASMREQGLPPDFFEKLAEAGSLIVVVKSDIEDPVGFAALTRVDGCPHLFQLSVTPEHGRQGLGEALVEEAFDWARTQGDTAMTLTTFKHLPWNLPFYRKLGFDTMENSALTAGLRACLEKEARTGLDPENRVAMKRILVST